MGNVFQSPICLFISNNNSNNYISIFDQFEEVERFQLLLGLREFCQSTILCPEYSKKGKLLYFQKFVSPHAGYFYSDKCMDYQKSSIEAKTKCEMILEQIAKIFCEKQDLSYLGRLQLKYELLPYPNSDTEQYYIKYKCPYVNLYKFGFPIYVEATVVAVLFIGQFTLKDHFEQPPSKNLLLSRLLTKNFSKAQEKYAPNIYQLKKFESEYTLDDHIKKNILPVILELTHRSARALIIKRKLFLKSKLEKSANDLETQVYQVIFNPTESAIAEDYSIRTQKLFWKLVKESIQEYFSEIHLETSILFVPDLTGNLSFNESVAGIGLYNIEYNDSVFTYDFSQAITKHNIPLPTSYFTSTSDNFGGDSTHQYLFDYLSDRESFPGHKSDLIFRYSNLQSFVLVLKFSDNILEKMNRAMRGEILSQLDYYFQKVVQLLGQILIKISEYNTKTVLRIFRHEITHQLIVLQKNNWFMKPERLQSLNENKLKLIAEDQLQCLNELDFISQNIKIFTGSIDQYVGTWKERDIDIKSDIVNKIISLYQKTRRERQLRFEIQQKGSFVSFRNNLELIDIIFFNLISNAIKYAYEGTNIIFRFEDTENFSRPHSLSVINFGPNIITSYHDEVFKLYFRGSATGQVTGSGIGLYISKKVANLLGANLSWNSTLVSNYNIPMLAQFMNLSPDVKNRLPLHTEEIENEYKRLDQEKSLITALNLESLSDTQHWSPREICSKIKGPTYKVQFTLEL